jgi:hypothetical protein
MDESGIGRGVSARARGAATLTSTFGPNIRPTYELTGPRNLMTTSPVPYRFDYIVETSSRYKRFKLDDPP